MFSGIVEAIGTIRSVEDRETTRSFQVEAPTFASELSLGDSVSVDGGCLTVVSVDHESFSVEVIGTTLERTIAGGYDDGIQVNLERALKMGTRLDGHIVQGHVDGVAHLIDCTKQGEFWTMEFALPTAVHLETIDHGSVTLNGVSLTVSELLPDSRVCIGVIPHTFAHTNLGFLKPGQPVNVEGDLVGKYVARILAQRAEQGV